MNNYRPLGELIDSISITHNFHKEKLVFLNTSDVEEGKILIDKYMPVSEMKGQAKKTIQNGDILYSEIRPKNKRYAYVKELEKPEDYVVSTKLMVLRKKSTELNNDYLYLFLTNQSTIDYLQSRAENRIGSFPQITFDIIRNLSIRVPSLKAQENISKVFFDINKKIELNNEINAELESMAKLIYDYWFVQFDFPDENGKPYKSSGGKMINNEELKREIPEGWEAKRIDEILKTELGGTPSTKIDEYWNGEYPWLNSGEIANFPIIDSELKVTESGISNSATSLMKKGTCVLSITRHLRPSILAVDSCANQSVVGIFESDMLKSSYIYPYLVNEIPRLMSLRTGAQQPHINKGVVDESPILIPEEAILNNYYTSVNPMYNKIINNSFQSKKLSELRDWLLPMLMNGQITVKD
tara:strand:- start:823 stop:2058 length:1236 start_codon:yes stop_codon:yes gene_type:complete